MVGIPSGAMNRSRVDRHILDGTKPSGINAEVPLGVAGGDAPAVDNGTLLKRVAQSDVDALRALCDRYGRAVSTLAYGILQDRAAAQQVARETFLVIWRDPLAFDPARGDPDHWILSLALERSLSAARRRSDPEGTAAGPVTHDAGIVAYAMGAVPDDLVKHVVEALPFEQRTVFVLAYYGELTQREIAARTGAPLEAVRIWVLHAVLRLCAALEAESGGSDS